MASEVSICNDALNLLGEDLITSLEDNNKAARLCNQFYASTRDALTRRHLWNFAMKRVELAEDTSSPIFGFSNQYELPADFLRLVRLEDTSIPYKIEGNKILISDTSLKIVYLRRIKDPNEFDELFREALSANLAWKMARPLTDSASTVEEARANFDDAMKEARTMDAMENFPDNIEADLWEKSRL